MMGKILTDEREVWKFISFCEFVTCKGKTDGHMFYVFKDAPMLIAVLAITLIVSIFNTTRVGYQKGFI